MRAIRFYSTHDCCPCSFLFKLKCLEDDLEIGRIKCYQSVHKGVTGQRYWLRPVVSKSWDSTNNDVGGPSD